LVVAQIIDLDVFDVVTICNVHFAINIVLWGFPVSLRDRCPVQYGRYFDVLYPLASLEPGIDLCSSGSYVNKWLVD